MKDANFNWIPQAFMEVIGKLLPGIIIVVASAEIFKTPQELVARFLNAEIPATLQAIASMAICYFIGLLFGEICYLLSELTAFNDDMATSCKKYISPGGEDHQKRMSQKWFCEAEEDQEILIQSTKSEYQQVNKCERWSTVKGDVIHDALRSLAPREATRLLKLRALEHFCKATSVAFLMFFLFHIFEFDHARTKSTESKWLLNLSLVATFFILMLASRRYARQFHTGTCLAFLNARDPSQFKRQTGFPLRR